MAEIRRYTSEELLVQKASALRSAGATDAAELWAAVGRRAPTTDEEDALDELERIAFLLGEPWPPTCLT